MKVYIFYLSDRPRLRLDVGPGPRSNFHLLRCRLHPLELSFSMAYQPHPNFDVHCETKIFALTPKFQMKSALTHRAGATKREKSQRPIMLRGWRRTFLARISESTTYPAFSVGAKLSRSRARSSTRCSALWCGCRPHRSLHWSR